MTQPTLFDDDPRSPPAQSHSETSKAAAVQIAPVAGRLRQRVYEWLLSRGEIGATDEEIQEALAMGGSTARPRRVELLEQHRIRDSGQKRPTRSGRAAVVWVAIGVKQ